MSPNLINTLILAGAYLLLFASAEIFYRFFNAKAEYTRKYVHLVTGVLAMFFPVMLANHWLVLFLCGSFLVILLLSMKFDLLPSINAVDRVTRGSLIYPVIVYCCFLAYNHYGQYIFYYIPILILAFSDPAAGLSGKKWPYGKYTVFGKTKTLVGSTAFLISAFILVYLLLTGLESMPTIQVLSMAFSIAIACAFAEAITHKGYDNLTIPIAAIGVLILWKEYLI